MHFNSNIHLDAVQAENFERWKFCKFCNKYQSRKRYNYESASSKSFVMVLWKHCSGFCEIKIMKIDPFILSWNFYALKGSPRMVEKNMKCQLNWCIVAQQVKICNINLVISYLYQKSGILSSKKFLSLVALMKIKTDKKFFPRLGLTMIMKVTKIKCIKIFCDEHFDHRNFPDLQYSKICLLGIIKVCIRTQTCAFFTQLLILFLISQQQHLMNQVCSFEITKLNSRASKKIDLYSNYTENKLQALTIAATTLVCICIQHWD